MKKTLTFAFILVLMTPMWAAFAQISGTDLAASATTPTGTTTVTTPATPTKPLTLTEKKLQAQTDLAALEAQFRLFVTRTQLTVDRLATKGIDTGTAQTELSLALTALNTARTNLELFAQIVVTDDMNDAAVDKAGIKPALVTIQDNLKQARAHLIESLTTLKTSVTLTATQ